MALRRSRVRFPSAPPLSLNTKSMISFSDAIKLGFMRYSDFRGRSTPAEYWWWFLFTLLSVAILSVVDSITGTYDMRTGNGLLSGLFRLVILVPSLALGARRLHDINKSGWWQLLWIVSFLIIPIAILLWWATKPSFAETNRYNSF